MRSFKHIAFRVKRFVLIAYLLILQTSLASSENDSTFIVRHGNTLYSISQIYGVTINELREWNNLADNTIYPGQILRVKLPQVKKQTNDTRSLPGIKSAETSPATRKLNSFMIPYGLQIAALEQRYDRHIHMALTQYLKPGTFMVDVRIEMEPIKETAPKHATTSLPSDYILPGLPFMPNGLKGWENTYQPGITEFNNLLANMQLKKLNVIVYVDSSNHTPQLSFIEHLVRAAAKVENQRKDQIYIIPQAFPDKTPFVAESTDFSTVKVEILEKKSSLAIPVLIISVSVIVILITLLMLIIFRKD